MKKQSIYRVWCDPLFQASNGELGIYSQPVREDYVFLGVGDRHRAPKTLRNS